MEEDYAFDFFISHASEDKDGLVRELTERLADLGFRVWYDEVSLRVGDSLRRSIDRGLITSRFGVLILSKAFLTKPWPQRELDGLNALHLAGGLKGLLPVWHGIGRAEVERFSPPLADVFAISTAFGIDRVVEELVRAVDAEGGGGVAAPVPSVRERRALFILKSGDVRHKPRILVYSDSLWQCFMLPHANIDNREVDSVDDPYLRTSLGALIGVDSTLLRINHVVGADLRSRKWSWTRHRETAYHFRFFTASSDANSDICKSEFAVGRRAFSWMTLDGLRRARHAERNADVVTHLARHAAPLLLSGPVACREVDMSDG